jgi:hypothetical protein
MTDVKAKEGRKTNVRDGAERAPKSKIFTRARGLVAGLTVAAALGVGCGKDKSDTVPLPDAGDAGQAGTESAAGETSTNTGGTGNDTGTGAVAGTDSQTAGTSGTDSAGNGGDGGVVDTAGNGGTDSAGNGGDTGTAGTGGDTETAGNGGDTATETGGVGNDTGSGGDTGTAGTDVVPEVCEDVGTETKQRLVNANEALEVGGYTVTPVGTYSVEVDGGTEEGILVNVGCASDGSVFEQNVQCAEREDTVVLTDQGMQVTVTPHSYNEARINMTVAVSQTE